MAVYRIVTYGDPILRSKAKTVTKFGQRIDRLIQNMADTMYAANGIGLAAPQIGVLKRAIVIDVGTGLIALINPTIIGSKGELTDIEGCLSIPGLQGEVPRAEQVTVEGLDTTGKEITITADGLMSRALQHEIDHLDGILFVDRALRVFHPDETGT